MLILLNLGQKHSDTLNVFTVNSTKGSYRIMLYRMPSANRDSLSYILHGLSMLEFLTIILPIRLMRLEKKKQRAQMMVEAGPSCRTGNSSRLSRMRMIVTTVIESWAVRHIDYGQYV